ncbi:MAG: hypothetical protein HKN14_08450 [Marinicaulis sp.]|nr:hypothetical protein [Marinicaulis sp.]
MLLRRITEHVKAQNWFAVGLDFLIVVVGVFIGLQVSNWNNVATAKAEEQQLLTQMQSDIAAAVTLKTHWLSDMEDHRMSLLESIEIIQKKPDQEFISDAHCGAMWSSHLIFYPVAPLGSLDEILAKGSLLTPQGQSVRPSLLRYRDHNEVIKQLNSSLFGLANLGDNYSSAFPRRVIATPEVMPTGVGPEGEQVARVTDSTFITTCLPNAIRADQAIQNKLLSNLARTDGVLQRVKIEIAALQEIQTNLENATP